MACYHPVLRTDRVCVKKRIRLNQEKDFQRVRKYGQKHAHPFFVLIALRNELDSPRLGVICSRNLGNAVQRNFVKRRIKEICRKILKNRNLGYDLIIIARSAVMDQKYADVCCAITEKLHQAELL